MPRISILILTIPKRRVKFNALMFHLKQQLKTIASPVQILTDEHPTDTIGTKRQRLLERADGDYIVFIDDDDDVDRSYISSILKAVESNPDCVGICGRISGVSAISKKWFISKEYQEWHEKDNVYYRHTNHLAPVKREIAIQVGFNNKQFGEDFDYSMGLRGLLHTEVLIPHQIYHYKYDSKKKK